jgi:hypothetical protein
MAGISEGATREGLARMFVHYDQHGFPAVTPWYYEPSSHGSRVPCDSTFTNLRIAKRPTNKRAARECRRTTVAGAARGGGPEAGGGDERVLVERKALRQEQRNRDEQLPYLAQCTFYLQQSYLSGLHWPHVR